MNLTKTKEDIIRGNQHIINGLDHELCIDDFTKKCMDDAVYIDKEKRWNEIDYFLNNLVDEWNFKEDIIRFLQELKDKEL